MSEKKNIDHFFKERLEHAEVAPPPMAWDNIEAQLRKKKKRRVIPFWWKLSGVAAVLFFGFLLFRPYLTGKPEPETTKPENAVVNQGGANSGKNTGSQQQQQKPGNNNAGSMAPSAENAIANADKTEGQNNTAAEKVDAAVIKTAFPDKKTPENAVAASKKTKGKQKNTGSGKQPTGLNAPNEALAESPANNKSKNEANNHTQKNQTNNPVTATQTGGHPNQIAEKTNAQDQHNEKQNSAIDKNTTITQRPQNAMAAQNKNQGNTNSVNTITGANPEEIKKKDSTNLAVVGPNALEELLNEKEKKIAKERKENRWQVTPNIAPIYFSSMGSGSPLDEKLAANEKAFNTSYSYGLNVNYAVGKKWQVRSGIHSFSTDYDTRNIVYYQSTAASKMQHVTPTLSGSLIQIDPLANVVNSFGRMLEEKFEGTLNQRMGYIEMPVEVSYKLLAKKFGIDLIGGFSTLYLTQNDVYLKADGFNMKIGEANNLNDFHWSTNVGLGLKYSFLKRLDLRVEPIFKYQLNTYSSGEGNFKPYIFGIYSGLSYHF